MDRSVRTRIWRCLSRHALTHPTLNSKSPSCTQLEPRALFSASPIEVDVLDIPLTNVDVVVESPAAIEQLSHTSISDLVFIDESVPDSEFLFTELSASGTDVILLDESMDGIEQITKSLEEYTDISAVHIISHGSNGSVAFGNSELTSQSLKAAAGKIAEWADALAEDANILFYGCDLASDAAGIELMESIAELTGANIAASDDVTGHDSLGGDYELEFATGEIHAGIIFDAEVQSAWEFALGGSVFAGGEVAVHQESASYPEHQESNKQDTDRGGRGSDSAVAISPTTGRYVVAYTSDATGSAKDDVFFQLFERDGSAVTQEIRVNDVTDDDQNGASVAMDDAGNFYISWTSKDSGGIGDNIYAKFFNADGSQRTSAFLVNASSVGSDTVSGNQENADIAVDSNGTVVSITWDGDGTVGGQSDNHGAYARTMNAADGSFLSDVIQLNEMDAGDSHQDQVAVAVDDAGISYAVWNDVGDAMGDPTVVGRKFAADGTLLSGEELGNEQVSFQRLVVGIPTTIVVDIEGTNPSIDVSKDGSTIVVALEARADFGILGDERGIIVQAYNSDFSDQIDYTDAEGFSTEEDALDQVNPSVAFSADDGSVILSWDGDGDINSQTDNEGVWYRKFDLGINAADNNNPMLTPTSGDILVNVTTSGRQEASSVAVNDSNNFVVAWSGNGVTDNDGVFVRSFGNAAATESTISGNVLEDILGDGSITSDPGLNNVNVQLYRDDGDGVISSGDQFVTSVDTSDGAYSFTVPSGHKYWVVVDSRSIVEPTAGGNSTAPIWAEQTFAAAGAVKEGSSGDIETATDGTFFGGRRAGVADDIASLLTAEHVIAVDLTIGPDSDGDLIPDSHDVDQTSGTDADFDGVDDALTYTAPSRTGVDFGFSFNVVTEVHDLGGASAQGTLRQFIDNANVINGANHMRFVPVTTQNSTDGSYWQIAVNSELPVIWTDNTTIDGTAYSTADGTTKIDSNAGFISQRHSRTTTVGVDDVTLSEVEAPELEITNGLSAATTLDYGLAIEGDSVEVEYVAIHGFGNASDLSTANMRIGNATDSSIDASDFTLFQSVIGTGADAFDAPATGDENESRNIVAYHATLGTISSNLIGFANDSGITISTGVDWMITGNEIRSNALGNPIADGVDLTAGTQTTSVTANLIAQNVGSGIDTWMSNGHSTFSDNTITGNGSASTGDKAGLRLNSSDNSVMKNVIANNAGDGVLVPGDLGAGAFTGNLISQNAFANNAGQSIDLSDGSDEVNGDGVTANDGDNANAIMGNQGLDFPRPFDWYADHRWIDIDRGRHRAGEYDG